MKILESYNKVILLLLWLILLAQLLFLAYFVKFDGNEGYYSIYPSLIMDGKLPYKDFFYHRLPLLPFLFVPAIYLPFFKLLSFRLLNVVFILFSYWIASKIAFSITKSKWTKHMVIFVTITSLYPNSFFITAQSYASFAMFLLIGIWLVTQFSNSKNQYLNPILAGLSFNIALGVRFGPDPLIISIPLVCILCIIFNFERKKFKILLSSFLIFQILIFLVCFAIDKDSFFWGVYVWPFKVLSYLEENGVFFVKSSLKYILTKYEFILQLFKNYLPILITLLIGFAFSDLSLNNIIKKFKINESNYIWVISSIIIFIDYLFFLLPFSSGIMQFSYVFPLLCSIACSFFVIGYKVKKDSMNINFIYAFCIFIMFLGLIGDINLSASFRTPGSDISIIGELGSEIKKLNKNNKKMVAFAPILAVESEMDLYQGFEFGAFGFFPKWDRERCEKYNLFNLDMLFESINSPNTDIFIMSNRLMNENLGLGKIFIPYREKIMEEVNNNFKLIRTFHYTDDVGLGPIKIYEKFETHPTNSLKK